MKIVAMSVKLKTATVKILRLKIDDILYAAAPEMDTCRDEVIQETKMDRSIAKCLPCLTIEALDTLQLKVSDKDSSFEALAAYVWSYLGTDINKSIKKALDMIMIGDVQKQLSWSGLRTRKIPFERKYKDVVQAMHFALKGKFADYNYQMLERKVMKLLQKA